MLSVIQCVRQGNAFNDWDTGVMINLMKSPIKPTLLVFLIGFLFLTTFIVKSNEGSKDLALAKLSAPMAQVSNSTMTPTATTSVGDQAVITPTLPISSTLAIEPFHTITLEFPEIQDTATSTSMPPTQTPSKGIPLSRISSNEPPAFKPGIMVGVIFSWLVLVIFAIFIARRASQTWLE